MKNLLYLQLALLIAFIVIISTLVISYVRFHKSIKTPEQIDIEKEFQKLRLKIMVEANSQNSQTYWIVIEEFGTRHLRRLSEYQVTPYVNRLGKMLLKLERERVSMAKG